MRASNRGLGALGRKSVRIFRRWPGFAAGVAVLALAAAAGVGVAPPAAHAGSTAPGQAPGERDERAERTRDEPRGRPTTARERRRRRAAPPTIRCHA